VGVQRSAIVQQISECCSLFHFDVEEFLAARRYLQPSAASMLQVVFHSA
jgi:hypothetical protein